MNIFYFTDPPPPRPVNSVTTVNYVTVTSVMLPLNLLVKNVFNIV